MLLRDLTKVYVSECEEVKDHGEIEKTWKYKGYVWLNIQQDLDELDRKPSGEVDYEILKARTEKDYSIKKGEGISFKNISKEKEFIPEYRVIEKNKIGSTTIYRLELYNGDQD